MKSNRRFRGTLRAVYAQWPSYALIYGGMVLALIVMGISAEQGWIGFIPLSSAVFIVLTYFLFTSLWSVYQQFDQDGLVPHHILFDMGQIKATDSVVFIDLGVRDQAIDMARRLTTGKVIVIDLYSTQWTPSRALVRYRSRLPSPPSDPRLVWQNGRLNLLPLPDKSVTAVILSQTLSQISQDGDKLLLLQEIYRVLAENGHLLLAERTRTQTNWLLLGPAALTLRPAEQWHDLLRQAGFRIRAHKDLQSIIHCVRADKPTYSEAQQLMLGI